jgi:hypothetical protein
MMRSLNYNWSAPELNEPYRYKNEFGEVVFTPVTDFMPIDDVLIEKIPAIRDVLVGIDEAEKITLVTENKRGMMSFCFPFNSDGKDFFGLQYSCRNRAAVCRVDIIHFSTPGNVSAQEQIESMAPKTSGPMPTY